MKKKDVNPTGMHAGNQMKSIDSCETNAWKKTKRRRESQAVHNWWKKAALFTKRAQMKRSC